MNRYEATVTLKVVVDAFDDSDARDILGDTFGPGEEVGVDITEYEVTGFAPVD